MAKASALTKQAKAWIGIREGSKEHKELIDLYNSHLPHPRGYKITEKDSWCAMFASCLAIKCNATDIIPIECSCEQFINLAKKMGIWIEDESITPKEGYFILYDWQDSSGNADGKGWADHIGYVEKVSGGTITVIEGNYSNRVKRRTIKANAKNIRGYVAPKYEEVSTLKIDPARSFEKGYSKEYTTTSDLNLRTGAGTSNEVVTVIPKGEKVRCYGYYTVNGSTRWLLVQYGKHTGFCSKKYLK